MLYTRDLFQPAQIRRGGEYDRAHPDPRAPLFDFGAAVGMRPPAWCRAMKRIPHRVFQFPIGVLLVPVGVGSEHDALG